MFRNFGIPELIIILIVVVLLFGPGRVGKLGGEIGKGIAAFRKGLKGEDEEDSESKDGTEENNSA